MAERQENIENSMRIKSDYELFLESYESKLCMLHAYIQKIHVNVVSLHLNYATVTMVLTLSLSLSLFLIEPTQIYRFLKSRHTLEVKRRGYKQYTHASLSPSLFLASIFTA